MKGIAGTVLVMMLAGGTLQAEEPEELLRKGLFEEEANLNLEKARESYLKLAEEYDQQRRYAATALFRLGEIARKQGNRDEAAGWYRRVLGEFPGNETLARLSKQNLKGLGMEVPPAGGGAPVARDAEQVELRRLKELEKSSPDLINGVDEKGWRPIHQAAAQGWLEVLDYLLEEGVEVDARASQPGWTPLHVAVGNGQLAVVRRLLEAGAKIEGEVDIMNAAGPYAGMPLAPVDNIDGRWRPLHLAVLWGSREVAKVLLAAGCERDPDGAEFQGELVTPVAIAAVTRQREMVDLLLAEGADLNHVAAEDPWPVVRAAIEKAPEMVPFLLEKGADPNHLDLAVDEVPQMLPAFIKAGADVNHRYRAGYTLLHGISDPELAKLFLAGGADLEARTAHGYTPLLSATRSGKAEMVRFFLSQGADRNVRAHEGEGVFDVARLLTVPMIYEDQVYPEAARPDSIVLFAHGDVSQGPERRGPVGADRAQDIAQRIGALEPPSVIDLLLQQNTDRLAWVRILRPNGKGGMTMVSQISGSALAASPPAFPSLQWGDVIEVMERLTSDVSKAVEIDPRGWWNSMPAREVTVKAGPWERRVRIDPQVMPWSRNVESRPWSEFELSSFVGKENFAIDRSVVTLVRGGVRNVLDVAGGLPAVALEDGDVLEWTLHEDVLGGTAERWKGARFLATIKGIDGFELSDKERKNLGGGMHLFGMLPGLWHPAPFESRIGASYVDFTKVRVLRPKEDGMTEIEIDVLQIANELMPAGVPENGFTAAAKDVELQDGDLIVLLPREEVFTVGAPVAEQPEVLRVFLKAAVAERRKLQDEAESDALEGENGKG